MNVYNACEVVRNRFYFLSTDNATYKTKEYAIVNTDKQFIYYGYFQDFGPLNISCIMRYCDLINKTLKINIGLRKRIVHVCSMNHRKKVNAAFLNGCYQICYLQRTAQQAHEVLRQKNYKYIDFRDASAGKPTFTLSLLSCLSAFYKAIRRKLFNLKTFNVYEYEYLDLKEHGSVNWIVPNKLLAFPGPKGNAAELGNNKFNGPELYVSLFQRWNITAVIRLNSIEYDAEIFKISGIAHYNMIFPDGGLPSPKQVSKFLDIVSSTSGAVAVHCQAGLGRTGTLIGCYLMKRFQMTASEAIGWMRLCRPGSVLGQQQNWLIDQEVKYLKFTMKQPFGSMIQNKRTRLLGNTLIQRKPKRAQINGFIPIEDVHREFSSLTYNINDDTLDFDYDPTDLDNSVIMECDVFPKYDKYNKYNDVPRQEKNTKHGMHRSSLGFTTKSGTRPSKRVEKIGKN